jgi:nitrogen regulatory protein P-II 2
MAGPEIIMLCRQGLKSFDLKPAWLAWPAMQGDPGMRVQTIRMQTYGGECAERVCATPFDGQELHIARADAFQNRADAYKSGTPDERRPNASASIAAWVLQATAATTSVRTWVWEGRVQMKLVIAIVRPFKLDEIREALTPLGVQGITVTEVKGFGRQKGQTEIYRGAEYHVSFLPKIKIEIAIAADQVDAIVDTICRVGQTGKIGDGKIFVLEIERAVRIRTGELDAAAL